MAVHGPACTEEKKNKKTAVRARAWELPESSAGLADHKAWKNSCD